MPSAAQHNTAGNLALACWSARCICRAWAAAADLQEGDQAGPRAAGPALDWAMQRGTISRMARCTAAKEAGAMAAGPYALP